MNHHPRRVCSPPFGFDPRTMESRLPYEDPYPAHQYEGSSHPIISSGHPSYMDHHGYPINYREQTSSLHSLYRASVGGPASPPPPPNQHRASSPPYKILCITNINPKVGDNAVKEALTNDYSRFGVASVSVCHDNGERLAYIYFQNYEEAREARYVKARTLFFDRPIEIEPIFDPRAEMNGSPLNTSPPVAQSMAPLYQPRRRSITPEYPDMAHRRQHPLTYSLHQAQTPQILHQRGGSPVEYPPALPTNAAQYPYGPSPTPMGPATIPHDRRVHGAGYGQPQSVVHPHSPYASPSHEPYRSPYPPPPPHHATSHHQFDRASTPPYGVDPYVSSQHHQYARGDRISSDGAYIRSRSPRSDLYYSQRNVFAPMGSHHYPSTRSSSIQLPSNPELSPSTHQQSSSTGKYRSPPPAAPPHHRNHRPDPPARYMSREFRREKFGSDHYNSEHDDGRPSRVLLVNNVDSAKTVADLKETFRPFGIVEEMEMKEVAPEISSALIKFSSMDGAYKARTAIDGRYIGSSRCRIVYGKVSASRRLWIGGLNPSTTVSGLEDECSKYGVLTKIEYTTGRPYAYVEYETANQAQFAAHHMKSILTPANERKIRIEFVDPERSEKLAPINDSSWQISEIGSKSRASHDAWAANEPETHLIGGLKRSVTPIEPLNTKKSCQSDESPIIANIFKQERLAAAAAAKARASSLTTSEMNNPCHYLDPNGSDRARKDDDKSELNNNGNVSNQLSFSNQANEDDTQDTPSQNEMNDSTCIQHIVNYCSVSWPSQITLRNFTFPVRIFLCSGRRQLIDKYFSKLSNARKNGREQYPILHITQRWRLHPQPKLEEVKRRMQSENSGYLIMTARNEDDGSIFSKTTPQEKNIDRNNDTNYPNPSSRIESGEVNAIRTGSGVETKLEQHCTAPASQAPQSRPLRNLISYLEQKDAAGVISLSVSDGACASDHTSTINEGSFKLLYVFPPGDFALNLIKRKAPNLLPDACKEEFLLGVIVGSNEAKI